MLESASLLDALDDIGDLARGDERPATRSHPVWLEKVTVSTG